MAVYVSPGVYIREIDLSIYAPQISTTILGMVGTATKGPVNTARFISSQTQFIREFGNPTSDHISTLSMLQFLSKGNQAYFVRVTDGTEEQASANITVGEGPAVLLGTELGPFSLSAASFGTVGGYQSGAGEPGPFTITASTSGTFTSGDASANLAALQAINNGELAVTYTDRDGVSTGPSDVGSVNLTTATNLSDVASILETAIQALGAPFDAVSVTYSAPNFVVSTGTSDTGSNAQIVIGNHSVGSGTDLTLPANMNFDGGSSAPGVDGNDVMVFSADAGPNQEVKLTAGSRTATQVANEINALSDLTANVETVGVAEYVFVRTNTQGSGGSITAASVDSTVSAYATIFGSSFSPGTVSGNDGTSVLKMFVDPFGYYVSGNVASNLAALKAVTNGSISVNLDGVGAVNVSSIDLSSASSLDDVASLLESAIQSAINADAAYIGTAETETIKVFYSEPSFHFVSKESSGANIGALSTISIAAGSGGTNLLQSGLIDPGPGAVAGSDSQQFILPGGSQTTDSLVALISGSLVGATVENYKGYLRFSTSSTGPSSFIIVPASSTADMVLGLDNSEHQGTVAGATTFTLLAATPGTDGNNLSVVVSEAYMNGLHQQWLLYNSPEEDSPYYEYRNAFKLDIFHGSIKVASFDNLTVDDHEYDSYIETVLGTQASDYDSSRVVVADDAGLMTMPQFGTFQFSGGSDGVASTPDFVGTPAGIGPATGLHIFENAETLDVNLLTVPGVSDSNVVTALAQICEKRADCMAIIDPPFGLDGPQAATDWANRLGSFSGYGQSINSSYLAIYWPWIKVYDNFNDVDVWTPPSGHVAGVYAYSDFVADPWIAPAGFNRASIIVAKALEHYSSQGDRDLLYGYPNVINPIVQFFPDGIVVWGQKTAQRKPSATDRVNVRRLLLYARKIVATVVRYLVFDPNESTTWRQFEMMCNPIFRSIQSRRGLYDFRVVCNESTNPPEQIDRSEMNGRIFLKPTKAAEVITVDFVLTTTGASFDEISY